VKNGGVAVEEAGVAVYESGVTGTFDRTTGHGESLACQGARSARTETKASGTMSLSPERASCLPM